MTQEQRDFFEALYKENYRKLYLHAYALLQDRSLAEVAVQEAAQTACQRIEALSKSQNPVGWMYKTIEHSALHMLRDARRDQALFSSLEGDGYVNHGADPAGSDGGLIEQCLTVVSKDEFSAFWRIMIEGNTYQEEADRAGISLWACYKRIARIRKRLQIGLEKNF